jgi:hypothetical protein
MCWLVYFYIDIGTGNCNNYFCYLFWSDTVLRDCAIAMLDRVNLTIIKVKASGKRN